MPGLWKINLKFHESVVKYQITHFLFLFRMAALSKYRERSIFFIKAAISIREIVIVKICSGSC